MNKKMFLLRVDPKQLLELKRLGKKKGGTAVSQLIRLAVADYLEREKRMEKR
jgi:metal-responsive CopG/Arc/MetJ family transcriptional regulator